MDKADVQILLDEYYQFIGIASKKKQNRILTLLSYCKEIRDTAYPMNNSKVTELTLTEFIARREKDLIYINGSLKLEDGEYFENRTFEAYIIEDVEEQKTRVYMDITRLGVTDEPKMIRTTEVISEAKKRSVSVITTYASTDSIEEKVTSFEIPKSSLKGEDYILQKKLQQISAI